MEYNSIFLLNYWIDLKECSVISLLVIGYQNPKSIINWANTACIQKYIHLHEIIQSGKNLPIEELQWQYHVSYMACIIAFDLFATWKSVMDQGD